MSDFDGIMDHMFDNIQMNQIRFCFKLWDVEHGLSIWIQTPSGHNHWIDLGKTESFSPSQHVLRMYNVDKIDYLTISHPDKDHLEDLPNFLQSFSEPRAISRNATLPENEKFGDLTLDYQKKFKTLDTRFIHPVARDKSPTNPEYNGGVDYLVKSNDYTNEIKGNDTSLVTMLLYNGLMIVCPGDIEPLGWEHLWNKEGSDFQKLIERARIRVLVAPHHGRKSGYSSHMMEVIEPHLVIISDIWGDSETHNAYREKPLGVFQNGQVIQYYSTKRHGRVEITENYSGDFEYHQYE